MRRRFLPLAAAFSMMAAAADEQQPAAARGSSETANGETYDRGEPSPPGAGRRGDRPPADQPRGEGPASHR